MLFLVVIYCAPDGLASLITRHQPVLRARSIANLLPAYAVTLVSGLIVLAGIVAAVEATYRLSDNPAASMLVLFGIPFSPVSASTWIFSAGALTVGAVLLLASALYVKSSWKAALARPESSDSN